VSKDDVPQLPAAVPTKRRQIEGLLDAHIAMWLAGDSITYGERRRLEGEKRRRKQSSRERSVGLLISQEGVTPEQQAGVEFLLRKSGATVIHHHSLPSRLHQACRQIAEVVVHQSGAYQDRLREVIHDADSFIAAPREMREPNQKEDGTVWWAIKHAKHRRKSVLTVLPDGKVIM
jgi:hypothetical protein